MKEWNELSMKDRAAFIKVGVANGLKSIDDIRKSYNNFANYEHIYDGNTEQSQKIERTPKMNWFTKATIGAAMADSPAVMTASGWQSQPDMNFHQERTKASDKLADNLEVIAMLADAPDLIETVPSIAKMGYSFIKHPKQSIGHMLGYIDDISQYIKEGRMFRTVDKPAIDDAISSGIIRSKTGLHHDTQNFLRRKYGSFLDKIPNWDTMDAADLRAKLKSLGAFDRMSPKEEFIEKTLIRNSTNHGGTVGYMKDTPYPNYTITKDNYIIDSPASKEHFHPGHHGSLYPFELDDPRAGVSVLIDETGNAKNATLTTKGSQYWSYSPFWKMWKPTKFAQGGPLSNTLFKPFSYQQIPEVRFANGGVKPDYNTVNNPLYNTEAVNPMYDYLRYKGLNHTQASSLMGNLAVESYLNADLKQIGGGPAYGLMQAEASRQTAMRNYNSVPYIFGSKLSPEEQQQLDYIVDKGINSYTPGEWGNKNYKGARDARKAFINETDINKASDIITRNFLRPSKEHIDRRRKMSNYYNQEMKNRFPFLIEDWKSYKNY